MRLAPGGEHFAHGGLDVLGADTLEGRQCFLREERIVLWASGADREGAAIVARALSWTGIALAARASSDNMPAAR